MTHVQKQSCINVVAQANGNLARLLTFPDSAFTAELDRLILTLQAFKDSSRPHLHDTSNDDEL